MNDRNKSEERKKMRGVHNAICSLFNNLREEEEEEKKKKKVLLDIISFYFCIHRSHFE